MMKPLGARVLVKMIPSTDEIENKLNLALVDKKKHWDHKSRRGLILAVGPDVFRVDVGEVVIMHGSAGKTFGEYDKAFDESYRLIKQSECEAVDDAWTEKIKNESQKTIGSPAPALS